LPRKGLKYEEWKKSAYFREQMQQKVYSASFQPAMAIASATKQRVLQA